MSNNILFVNQQIVEKSPPLEDIPRNIDESIKDLIERGFTVCAGQRPTSEALLLHPAFRLLQGIYIMVKCTFIAVFVVPSKHIYKGFIFWCGHLTFMLNAQKTKQLNYENNRYYNLYCCLCIIIKVLILI